MKTTLSKLGLALALVLPIGAAVATPAIACHDNAEEHWEWQEEWGAAYPPGDPVYDEPIGGPEDYGDDWWEMWAESGW